MSLSGQVLTEDGTPPAGSTEVELVCGGAVLQQAYIDSTAGGFALQIESPEDMTGRAGMGQHAPSMDASTSSMPSFGHTRLDTCELRASVLGYQPAILSLSGVDTRGWVSVGTIIVHRAARARGATISARALRAPRKARKVWEKGHRALGAGKLAEAQAALAAAIQIDPQYAPAWSDLGWVHLRRGDHDGGKTAFGRALAADAQFVPAHLGLAVIAAMEQRWQEAADLSSRAIQIQPLGFPQAHYLHAVASLELGRLAAAETSAAEASRQDPGRQMPEIDHLLGLIQARNRNYAVAAKYLRSYLHRAAGSEGADVVKRQLQEIEALASGLRPAHQTH